MRNTHWKGIAIGMLLAAGLGLGVDVAAQTGLLYAVRIRWDAGPWDLSGSADPESNVRAPQGSIYRRTNGLIYRKSTAIGTTGWKDLANIASLTSSVSNNALAATDGSGNVSWSTAVDPVMTGSGAPEGAVTAAAGRLYRNTATGLIYWKASGSGNTGWSAPISSLAALITNATNSAIAMTDGAGVPSWTANVEPFLTGSGAPEGAQTAVVGRVYRDTATGLLYRKQTGSGNTGWSAALSDIASLITNTANSAIAMTDGSGLASWTTGVEPIYTGSGNPQGVVSAALGRDYRDTATGYRYRKMGGGSTAYGWYLVPSPVAGDGPLPWIAMSDVNAAGGGNNFSGSTGFGPFIKDVTALFTGSSVSNGAKVVINGKSWNTGGTSGTAGTCTSLVTLSSAEANYMGDDFDLWALINTDATAVTATRIVFGMSSVTPTDSTTAPAFAGSSSSWIYVQYKSDGNAVWEGQTTATGSASRTTTASLGSVVAATSYKLRIRFVRSGTPTVYFSVNDGTEISTTGTIPVSGTALFLTLAIDQPSGATGKNIRWRAMGGTIGS